MGENLLGRNENELVLTYAGNIVRHLGVQMYSGRPVPAIAELISNAWDADASQVDVSLPLGESWRSDSDQTIVVADDGHGMDWHMVRDAYLDVGRDRRREEGTDRTPKGRKLQGRKGIGKLAGFGIADVVEVQTVSLGEQGESVLIWFKLDLDRLRGAGRKDAPVELIFAGPTDQGPDGARQAVGTTVTLKQLHARRAVNSKQFMRSMARRFLLSPGFHVRVNGAELEPEEFPLQWRDPEKGWQEDEVSGCGPVEYWVGFSERPLKQSDGDLSGILIYTRSKVSQEATFFDISGGVTGQHGLRYMCGMVKAEWLDKDVEAPDLIATHRGSIAWESPEGQAFQEWGQEIVKQQLKNWAKRRSSLRKKRVLDVSGELRKRIDQLSPPYQRVATTFIEKFQDIEMEPGEFQEITEWFLAALENATLRNIIDKLRVADLNDLSELDDLLGRMELRAAVTLLQIIESNLTAIETLERMHLENALERGVLAKHLERNPWLIHPTWLLHQSEARVSTWIERNFDLPPKGDADDARRVDFFCVGVAGVLHIVEIKRGQHVADNADMLQANKYREYVERRFGELSEPEAITYSRVESHLVAASLHEDAASIVEAYRDKGWVKFTTWDDLIERAKRTHSVFREALKRTVAAGESSVSED